MGRVESPTTLPMALAPTVFSMSGTSEVNFLVKVTALSAGLGIVIKYLLPHLGASLNPSLGLALVLLLAPSVLMVVLLWGWSVFHRPHPRA